MDKIARIILEGVEYEFPVVVGTEGEKAIDISTLRSKTGHITLDPGFGNTGSCRSAIPLPMVKTEFCIIVAYRSNCLNRSLISYAWAGF